MRNVTFCMLVLCVCKYGILYAFVNCKLLHSRKSVDIALITMEYVKLLLLLRPSVYYTLLNILLYEIRVITKLANTEQSSKGKGKTHKSTNRQNQSTTGKLGKPQWPLLGTGISKEMVG